MARGSTPTGKRSYATVLQAPSPAAAERKATAAAEAAKSAAAAASDGGSDSGVSFKAFFCLFLTVNIVASLFNHIDDTDGT